MINKMVRSRTKTMLNHKPGGPSLTDAKGGKPGKTVKIDASDKKRKTLIPDKEPKLKSQKSSKDLSKSSKELVKVSIKEPSKDKEKQNTIDNNENIDNLKKIIDEQEKTLEEKENELIKIRAKYIIFCPYFY